MNPVVCVSLTSYLDGAGRGATFTANLHGAYLPGVPVTCSGKPIDACTLGLASAVAGRAHVVASMPGATFAVILLPAALLKTGRNRLWRLRDETAALLPAEVRAPFVSGRTGIVKAP